MKGEKIFSPCLLNSPVPLVVYVACCLRKRGSMAFCEKSCTEMDFILFYVCVKKRVMLGTGNSEGIMNCEL